MKKPHRDDICIGQDRWIEFLDLGDSQSYALDIDPFLRDLLPLFEAIEVHCVADCCGIGAFGFWPEEIERAYGSVKDFDLREKVLDARNSIEMIEGNVIVSHRLNNYFVKSVFIALLDHIESTLANVSGASSDS